MALYTIGEVALLCDINPVTLRAWQRRYGLLTPQRTDGGHRLFSEADIDRIREIQHWVESGVQVSKVQALLANSSDKRHYVWQSHQERAMHLLQQRDGHTLQQWLSELMRDHPAKTLAQQLINPLRARLQGTRPAYQAKLSLLDGILINLIAGNLSASRQQAHGRPALVVGWGVQDSTRLWIEGWIASQQEWQVGILAHPFTQFHPEMFKGKMLLVWCGDSPSPAQQQQLQAWQETGHQVWLLGI